MSLLVLSDADIREVISPRTAINTQRDAYLAAVSGQVAASGVTATHNPADDSLTFAHTGAIAGVTGVACKFGMQVPGNAARGLPAVHAIVTLLDPVTGEPAACLNGTTITAIRTAAGVAAAAEVLARPDASRLGLIGAGVQAREAARMISEIRPLSRISVCSLSAAASAALAAELQGELGVPSAAAPSAERVAVGSDILVTATTSLQPVVQGSWLAPGSTVLTVGSYEPARRELDITATARADGVFADEAGKAMATCGILVEASEQDVLRPGQITQIGDVIGGTRPGRRAADDLLVFHSVGLGVQDAALTWAAYQLAEERRIGKRVDI
jgi:ornithine cyclodeaminase